MFFLQSQHDIVIPVASLQTLHSSAFFCLGVPRLADSGESSGPQLLSPAVSPRLPDVSSAVGSSPDCGCSRAESSSDSFDSGGTLIEFSLCCFCDGGGVRFPSIV